MAAPTIRSLPTELIGVVDPRLYARLQELFNLIYQLQTQPAPTPSSDLIASAVQRRLQQIGLVNAFGTLLIGLSSADPQVSQLGTGTGSVTSVTGSGDANVTTTITSPTTTPNVGVTLSLTPTLTTVNVGVGGYKVSGTKVVGAQGAAVADATGAGDVVAQLNALLARMRAHGLIA